MKEICIRIKELRKELDMSQIEFAKGLGVTNAHISKIEKGKTVPSEALLKLISREYKINEEWLKHGELPIYIYEILDKTEEYLEKANSLFNSLLSSDSYLIRNIGAEMEFSFANITDISNLDETIKIEYLTTIKNMFHIINQYNLLIKYYLESKQTVMDNILESHFENYKLDIEQTIDDLKKLIKN